MLNWSPNRKRWTKPNLYSCCKTSIGEEWREMHCSSSGLTGPWYEEMWRGHSLRSCVCLQGLCGKKLLCPTFIFSFSKQNKAPKSANWSESWWIQTDLLKPLNPKLPGHRGAQATYPHTPALCRRALVIALGLFLVLLLSSRGHEWVILPWFAVLPAVISLFSGLQSTKMSLRCTPQFATSFSISWSSLLFISKMYWVIWKLW